MNLTVHVLIGLFFGFWLNKFWAPWGLVIGIVYGFISGILAEINHDR